MLLALPKLSARITNVTDEALAQNPLCLKPVMENAFKTIRVTEPQDISSFFPNAPNPAPVPALDDNAASDAETNTNVDLNEAKDNADKTTDNKAPVKTSYLGGVDSKLFSG